MAKEVEVKAPEAPVQPERVSEAFTQNVKETTKAALAAQPKQKIRLAPAQKGESNFEIVGVNGHNYQIQRGVAVEVPQTVFDILADAGKV